MRRLTPSGYLSSTKILDDEANDRTGSYNNEYLTHDSTPSELTTLADHKANLREASYTAPMFSYIIAPGKEQGTHNTTIQDLQVRRTCPSSASNESRFVLDRGVTCSLWAIVRPS